MPSLPTRSELEVSWFELFYDLILIAAIAVTNDSFLEHPSGSTALVAIVGFVGLYWIWLLTVLSRNIAPRLTVVWRLAILVQMVALTLVALSFKSEESIHWSTGLIAYAVALLVVALLIWHGGRVSHARRLTILAALLAASAAICLIGGILGAEQGEGWFVAALVVSITAGVITATRPDSQIALQRDHVRERLGLFILIIVGEGIAQLVHALFGLEKIPNLGVFGFTFAVVFVICWLYFDLTMPRDFGNHKVHWPLLFLSHLVLAIGLIGALDSLALFAVRQEAALGDVSLSIFTSSLGIALVALACLGAVSRSHWGSRSTVDAVCGLVLIVGAVAVIPGVRPPIWTVMISAGVVLGVVVIANVAGTSRTGEQLDLQAS